jgi:hypothetical protein
MNAELLSVGGSVIREEELSGCSIRVPLTGPVSHGRAVCRIGVALPVMVFPPRLWHCGSGALARCAGVWMWRERVEQNLVVVGEARGGGPESFEDVGRRAEHHDADLPGLSQDGYGGVFGGLSVVGEPVAGDHFPPGQG